MSILYQALTDADLALLLKDGHEDAFRVIYERYWQRLYKLASRRLADPCEAEEVVQDIFCNLWRRRASFVLAQNFESYFSVAVKFEVINRLARRSRTIIYIKDMAATLSPSTENLLAQLDYNKLQQQLQVTSNALPEKRKMAFQLKHESGFTLKQIAHQMNISVKAVEANLTRAHKVIRGMMASGMYSFFFLFCFYYTC